MERRKKMKKMVMLFLSVGLLFASHSSFAAGGPDFQEGLWEITSVSEMPGMGKMQINNKLTGRRIGNCK